MLAGLYLVTPVLQAALQAAPDRKRLLVYCLAVWVAVTALQDLYPAFAVLSYFPIAGKYLGYYLLGCYLCEQANDRAQNLKIGALGFPLAYALNGWMMACGHELLTLEILEVLEPERVQAMSTHELSEYSRNLIEAALAGEEVGA